MDSMQIFETAVKLQREHQAFAWVTVLHAQAPTSARPGDKAIVLADGSFHGWVGGGCAQPAVIKTARLAISDGRARTIRIAPAEVSAERSLNDVLEFGMACHSGGTLELFVDPILPAQRLTVIGDSPVARALVALAPRIGFEVSLVAHATNPSEFPDAHRVFDNDDAAHLVSAHGRSDWVVVASQGRRDMEGLKAALALRPHCTWFVASARKAGVLKDSLLAAGQNPEQVAAIVAPAGQIVGARTPEEIALSVLAALVGRRRQGHAEQNNAAKNEVLVAAEQTTQAAAPQVSCCSAASSMPALALAEPVVALANVAQKSCCGS